MNTARMNSLLNRQKNNLVTDALYALVVTIAMVVYLVGLGASTSQVRVAYAPVETLSSANLDALCTPVSGAAGERAWIC